MTQSVSHHRLSLLHKRLFTVSQDLKPTFLVRQFGGNFSCYLVILSWRLAIPAPDERSQPLPLNRRSIFDLISLLSLSLNFINGESPEDSIIIQYER